MESLRVHIGYGALCWAAKNLITRTKKKPVVQHKNIGTLRDQKSTDIYEATNLWLKSEKSKKKS